MGGLVGSQGHSTAKVVEVEGLATHLVAEDAQLRADCQFRSAHATHIQCVCGRVPNCGELV